MTIPKPNFLERMRNSDDATKKKIIIIATIVIMAIIITIWLIFFNPVAQSVVTSS